MKEEPMEHSGSLPLPAPITFPPPPSPPSPSICPAPVGTSAELSTLKLSGRLSHGSESEPTRGTLREQKAHYTDEKAEDPREK